MKKVLASLLVLASLSSFGGVVSFAEDSERDSNLWWCCVDFNIEPEHQCTDFNDCLLNRPLYRQLTNRYYDLKSASLKFTYEKELNSFKPKKVLGIFSTEGSKCVDEFNNVNNKYLEMLSKFQQDQLSKDELTELDNLWRDKNDKFLECLPKLDSYAAKSLYLKLWDNNYCHDLGDTEKVAALRKEVAAGESIRDKIFKLFLW